jgi:23S rRNA (uracil1939-C5)-methyltransferase
MKSMTMGEIFTAPVERIAAGGAGIARFEGQGFFIDQSAPGDRVKARVVELHRTWGRAELVEILEPSPQRVSPPCPLYGRCGGCSLQHLSYEAQIAEKSAILRDAFVRIGGFSDLPPLEIRPSPPYEYRNRIQLHRLGQDPGVKGRKSGDIVAIKDCPVADPVLRAVLGGKTLVPPPDRERFTLYARGKTVLSEGGAIPDTPSRGGVFLRDRELVMDAGVFFQSNGTMLEALIAGALEAADRADPSLPMADIYCGVGTFAAFFQDRFPQIDLVEENRAALNLARKNVPAARNRFFALTDDEWVRRRRPSAGDTGGSPYGFILADPPRQGLSRSMRSWFGEAGPPVLAYVSCDPATLARDCRELCAAGYRIAGLTFYDFYPQTAHIESLAVLIRDRSVHGPS